MKKLRIYCEAQYGARSPRKTVSFPVTDEMCEHLKRLFAARNREMTGEIFPEDQDPELRFEVEGHRSMKIYMQIVDYDTQL